jgi:uncharacterized protein YkwD
MMTRYLHRRIVLLGVSAALLIAPPLADVTATPPLTAASSITRAAVMSPDAPEFSGCGGINQLVVNAEYEQQVVDLVNLERANRGLPPYKRVTALDEAARYHSADLGQDNYFDHNTYDRVNGNLVYVCDTWTRIGKYYAGASGENIAAGYSTPQSVMNGWMNSTGHRNNILSTHSREIGVGYANQSGSDYYHYWTQDFGRRSGVYPLIINRDAASTDSRNVSLYVYGTNSDFQQMRLKNDNGTWGNWQTFQNNVTWTIANGVGTHTVTAELKNGSAVVTSTDTIYLSQADSELGNLPDALTFLYSIPQGKLVPAAVTLTPTDVGTHDSLSWTLAQAGTWFNVSPLSGITPASFQITPTGFDTGTPATYTGGITVSVTNPPGTIGSPQRIDLTLRVINTPLYDVYLPSITR